MKWGLLIALLLAACRPADMYRQNKGRSYRPSAFFPEDKAVRQAVPGTVPRLESSQDARVLRPTAADITTGRARYDIHCAPCHGLSGEGDGLVVQRGYPQPFSLHEAAVRERSLEHYVQVIGDGQGQMPAMATQIAIRDRWLIAHYIRVLQASRRVPLASIPAMWQEQLQEATE